MKVCGGPGHRGDNRREMPLFWWVRPSFYERAVLRRRSQRFSPHAPRAPRPRGRLASPHFGEGGCRCAAGACVRPFEARGRVELHGRYAGPVRHPVILLLIIVILDAAYGARVHSGVVRPACRLLQVLPLPLACGCVPFPVASDGAGDLETYRRLLRVAISRLPASALAACQQAYVRDNGMPHGSIPQRSLCPPSSDSFCPHASVQTPQPVPRLVSVVSSQQPVRVALLQVIWHRRAEKPSRTRPLPLRARHSRAEHRRRPTPKLDLARPPPELHKPAAAACTSRVP